VGLEDLDQALVLALVGLQALQLVAAGAEGAGGRVAQGGDVLGGLLAGVDQVLGQRPDDAVAAGVDVGDLVGMARAVSMTPQAEALITAVTPPDWA
jgi:hypothetical protein